MQTYYFDYNATTPILTATFEAMKPFFGDFYANPSSLHHAARAPYRAIRNARRQVAGLLNVQNEHQIVFTSGGTESNNAAILAAIESCPGKNEIVTSSVEHSSIRNLFEHLSEKRGYRLRIVEVDSNGALKLGQLADVVNNQTAIVSIMWANNETGVVFPIDEIAKIVKSKNVLFHVDAIQGAGKIPLRVEESGVDYLSVAAHKIYGPKGIGALYIRKGAPFHSLMIGGSQERGKRAGTENVPAIVGFGQACATAQDQIEIEMQRLRTLRDDFEKQVKMKIQDVMIHGETQLRISNTSNLRFPGIDGEALLMALDREGICVSRGSACMSGGNNPSYVLKAMGLSDAQANAAMRFSFGKMTEREDVLFLIKKLTEIINRLRELSSKESKSLTFLN